MTAKTISRINPETLPDAGRVGYSQISVTEPGRLAFVSGQVAWRRKGDAVPADLETQTDVVVENLQAALAALQAAPSDIALMRIYLTELTSETQNTVMTRIGAFLQGCQPSLTGIGVSALASPDLKIEVEMIVRLPD